VEFPSIKKRLEKVTGGQCSLLRDLTDASTLDAASLQNVLDALVEDRLEMARGMLEAARILARSEHRRVRVSAVSRANYAAYQAARAVVLGVHHRDEGDHEELGKEIDDRKQLPPGRRQDRL